MFVPFILKTTGFFIPKVDNPLIKPNAIISHLAIPANIFTSTA